MSATTNVRKEHRLSTSTCSDDSAANASASSSNKQPTLQSFISQKSSWTIDSERSLKIHKKIGLMMAIDLQPFSLVENKGFRDLLHELEPRYEIPSRNYFRDRILPDIFKLLKANVSSAIAGAPAISFTTDMWTSQCAMDSYMSVTAHWISEDFNRKSALLICEHFEGPHTGMTFDY